MEQPALPVEYVPYDESVEITGDISRMDAAQYMSWVRSQANRLPNVFRAAAPIPSTQVPTPYMPVVEDVLVCPDHLRADPDWEREAIYAFSGLRSALEALAAQGIERTIPVPAMKDRQGWLLFCLAVKAEVDLDVQKARLSALLDLTPAPVASEPAQNQDSDDDREGQEDQYDSQDDYEPCNEPSSWSGLQGSLPTTQVLLQLDQVLTQRLLQYLIDHVEQLAMTKHTAQWLYGLLARLEKPLHRETSAMLRQLYRRCALLRTTSNDVAELNLLALLVGYYFGQGEGYERMVEESGTNGDGTAGSTGSDESSAEDIWGDMLADAADGDEEEEGMQEDGELEEGEEAEL